MINTRIKLSNRTLILAILLLIALVSNLVLSKVVTNPKFNAKTIESLEQKKDTIMKLAAASTATSTALTLLPGDIATPIAHQMAELSKYFLFILSVILLEKILVAVVGYVSFSYIIPLACALGIVYLYIKKDIYKNIAIKLVILGLIIFLAIPVSMKISDVIYTSHQDSIEQTVKAAKENKDYIEEKKGEIDEEEKGLIGKIGDYISDLTSKVGIGISEIIKRGEDTFNSFLDAIAILIITTCVVPLIVISIFIWSIKILFSFDIKVPRRMLPGKSKTYEND